MKKTLLALGVAGLGSLLAAPAFAQTYASGSSTIVLMNGASQSVGAEIVIPAGTYFTGGATYQYGVGGTAPVADTSLRIGGSVVLLPTLADATNNLAVNQQAFAEFIVDPGLPDSVASLTSYAPSSFTQAASAALNIASDATNISGGGVGSAFDLNNVVSIIRAGAGVEGLD